LLGREDFLAGNADFVLSGVSFQPGELEQAKKSLGDFIDVPVQVSSLAILLTDPVPDGFKVSTIRCDPDDPTTWPPDVTDGTIQCLVKKDLAAPLHIPPRNLAAMLLRYPGHAVGSLPLYTWRHPDVLQQLGVKAPDELAIQPLAGPSVVGRSDGDETTYYLQHFIKQIAPDVWQGLQEDNPQFDFEPIGERLARLAFATRDGTLQQVNQMAIARGGDPITGSISQFTAGVIAPAPASALGFLRSSFAGLSVRAMEIPNADGDYIAPTPESINKAIDAGGDTPLYALTNHVEGAYPLVWVDHLYAPAHGLSPAKTEALATTIRYLVTEGQKTTAAVGEGRLPEALVLQALAGADQLVTSNCTQDNADIVASTDPGPMAPDVDEMKQIGVMLHCVETSPTATTSAPTTTPVTANNFNNGGSNFGGEVTSGAGALGSGGSTGTSGGGDSGSADGNGGGKGGNSSATNAMLTASKLPLPTPGSTPLPDRAATFLLGAGLFLLLRKPVTGFAKRALG
jgi:ABC-type phosphate transport system substrate-binding protein